MTKTPIPFALRLRQLREARGLSQYDLASKSGIRQPTIWRYEAGEREPDLPTLRKLAEALGIKPSELVD